jgi:hypothetical protein
MSFPVACGRWEALRGVLLEFNGTLAAERATTHLYLRNYKNRSIL